MCGSRALVASSLLVWTSFVGPATRLRFPLVPSPDAVIDSVFVVMALAAMSGTISTRHWHVETHTRGDGALAVLFDVRIVN